MFVLDEELRERQRERERERGGRGVLRTGKTDRRARAIVKREDEDKK